MDNFKDYYQVLGLDRDASAQAIEKAFQKLQSLFQQSDLTTDTTLSRKFDEIFEAHYVLSDPDKKAEYDQYYDDQQQPEELEVDPAPQPVHREREPYYPQPQPVIKKRSNCFGYFLLIVIALLVLGVCVLKSGSPHVMPIRR